MLALLCALVIALTGFSGSPQGSAGTFTAPTNVMATSADGTITVSWTPGSGAASQVTVVVNVLDDTDYCLGFDATGSGSSYECEGVTAEATYVVLVIALDGQGGYEIGRDSQGNLVTHTVPDPAAPQTPGWSTDQLGALFDEIISKTEQREAFSEIKERNIGFSALEDMRKLRPEFVASRTETELYHALWKLSNARRDRHLQVSSVDGGLEPPEERPCVSAPIHVLPDLSDVQNPTFFVGRVDRELTSPRPGDVIVSVNGQSMAEYTGSFTPWIRHSSLPMLYWIMAYDLPKRVSHVPQSLYSERLNLTLERPSGQHYSVSLPYHDGCYYFNSPFSAPGFVEVMRRENFHVLLDRNRQIILLRWRDFEYSLIQDIMDLTEYAEREQILDYDMIIDVTYSGGGSRGAYAIQRLVDRPFRVTFGNVRLSDAGKGLIDILCWSESQIPTRRTYLVLI